MENTRIYKNIEIDTEQLAITMTALEKFVSEQKESISFYTNQLNASSSTQDVRDLTDTIRSSKKRIKQIEPLIEQMAFNEFTTKHTL
tara:strand:+ start:1864 stop:2124 length:261 start_codon:yes stop_codon:yes gene_type:complete